LAAAAAAAMMHRRPPARPAALLLLLLSPAATVTATVSDGSYRGGAEEISRRAGSATTPPPLRARNVLLFIADGNGISTNYATRIWAGQERGGYGDEYVLPHETMPALALAKTYNTNAATPDSAGTATALHAGVKTKSGVLGLSAEARKGFCEDVPGNEVSSIAEHAKGLGKKVGVVSTARMTHATPGAVYCHSADRDWEAAVPEGCTAQPDIATQLYDAMLPGGGAEPLVDVGLGGGRRSFFPRGTVGPEGDEGEREDGVDLIERFTESGGAYAWNLPTFEALPVEDSSAPLLGLFSPSHMEYEYDRVSQNHSEPSLAQMTAAAVRALEARDVEDRGWFLMVESGRIDHANHAGNLFRTVTEGEAYQEAVAWALSNTDEEETLLISTADHSHGLEFNGYCGRGSPITGLCYQLDDEGERHLDEALLDEDGRPYTVAGYLNGEGSVLTVNGSNALEVRRERRSLFFTLPIFLYETSSRSLYQDRLGTGIRQVGRKAVRLFPQVGPDGRPVRPELEDEEARQSDYQQQALVPLYSETHSATDVAVYARGPSSQLIYGTMEQSWIFHVMKHAFDAPAANPVPGRTAGAEAAAAPPPPPPGGGAPVAASLGSSSMDPHAIALIAGVGGLLVGAVVGGIVGHRAGHSRRFSRMGAEPNPKQSWEQQRLM